MFTQTLKNSSYPPSTPAFKQALNKPSSISNRGVRAFDNKENIPPYVHNHPLASIYLTSFRSSIKLASAKHSSATCESQVNKPADLVQKKSSCYRVMVSRFVISDAKSMTTYDVG